MRSLLLALACLAAWPAVAAPAKKGASAKPPEAPKEAATAPAPVKPPEPAKKADPAKPKIAVLELEAAGVDANIAKNASEVLVSAVNGTGCCTVISSSDIRSMLGFERQRQLLNCTEESSCLAEIGGALGVDKIVSGSVGNVGKTFLLNVRLMDMKTARVDGRVSERVTGEPDALFDVVDRAVGKLFHLEKEPPAPVAVVPPQALEKPVIPARSAWAWPLVGTGVAALGGAVACALLGHASYADYEQQLLEQGAEKDALVSRANLLSGVAIGLAAVALGAGGTGGYLAAEAE